MGDDPKKLKNPAGVPASPGYGAAGPGFDCTPKGCGLIPRLNGMVEYWNNGILVTEKGKWLSELLIEMLENSRTLKREGW
jgi:hypothetical protein